MLTKSSGQKRHNDYRYVKVGRIRMNSWPTVKLYAGDIYISEREFLHIQNRHNTELELLGLTAHDYVLYIVNHFSEIRKDSRGAYFFAVSSSSSNAGALGHCAVVELEYRVICGRKCYRIKSARPMLLSRLKKLELVCGKPR